jgi:hypothetical protein
LQWERPIQEQKKKLLSRLTQGLLFIENHHNEIHSKVSDVAKKELSQLVQLILIVIVVLLKMQLPILK